LGRYVHNANKKIGDLLMSVRTSLWPVGWRTLLWKGWLSEIWLKRRGQPGKNWDLGITIRQHILSTLLSASYPLVLIVLLSYKDFYINVMNVMYEILSSGCVRCCCYENFILLFWFSMFYAIWSYKLHKKIHLLKHSCTGTNQYWSTLIYLSVLLII